MMQISRSSLLYMDALARAGISVSKHENFSKLEMRPARLAGNAPFIVDKGSGEIHSLGTAKPLEEYLQDYEIKKATFGLP
ncbi:protein [Escherichia coli]|uniref:Protein n=1 Tax=Escherichia coli TaxID=562 RepID=A0A484YA85_ECOLX|nr:protein [Escherichia coli]